MSVYDGDFQVGDLVFCNLGIGKILKIDRIFSRQWSSVAGRAVDSDRELNSRITVLLTHKLDGNPRSYKAYKKFFGPLHLTKIERDNIQKIFDRIMDIYISTQGNRNV